MSRRFEHIIPKISDWPISQFGENRSEYVEGLTEYAFSRFQQLHEGETEQILEKTIYLEKIRTKKNPWKVDPPNENNYWRELEKELNASKVSDDKEAKQTALLHRIITRYCEEITGHFKEKTYKFSRSFLRSVFKRLLNTAAGRNHRRIWGNKHQLHDRIKIEGYVDEFRALFDKGTVVVVPTHFSNLDSAVIGYCMDLVVGVPAFSFGAGLNLYDMELVAYFINRLGVYKVDRRKKNPIYLECLKSMACFSLRKGVNNIFFPGGTRSRNGAIEERLKLGLLGSVVETQRTFVQEGTDNKIYVVPLVLGYNFVLEAKYLVDQFLKNTGKEKYVKNKDQSSSYTKITKFIWSLFSVKSEITLSFGEPIDVLGNLVNDAGESIDKDGNQICIKEYFEWAGNINIDTQRETVYTKMLGEEILKSYYRNNVVLASHLVSYCAFKIFENKFPKINLFDLVNKDPKELRISKSEFINVLESTLNVLAKWESENKIKLSDELKSGVEEVLKIGLGNIGAYHVDDPLKLKDECLISESIRLLYFYHNRMENYGLEKYVTWAPEQESLVNELTEN